MGNRLQMLAFVAPMLMAFSQPASADSLTDVRRLDELCIALLSETEVVTKETWIYDEGAGWAFEWEFSAFKSELLAGALNYKNTYHETGYEQFTQCFRADGSALSMHRYKVLYANNEKGEFQALASHHDLFFDPKSAVIAGKSAYDFQATRHCAEILGYANLKAVFLERKDPSRPGEHMTSWLDPSCD